MDEGEQFIILRAAPFVSITILCCNFIRWYIFFRNSQIEIFMYLFRSEDIGEGKAREEKGKGGQGEEGSIKLM